NNITAGRRTCCYAPYGNEIVWMREGGSTELLVFAEQALGLGHLPQLVLHQLEALAQPRRLPAAFLVGERLFGEHRSDVIPAEIAINAQEEKDLLLLGQRLAQLGELGLGLRAQERQRRGAHMLLQP